jgi:hypothetical protein
MSTEEAIEPGFRAVQESEVFDFAEALDEAELALRPFRGQGQEEHEFALDFTLLSAAEASLVPSLVDPINSVVSVPLEEPLHVSAEAVRVAVARADCGWTNLHGIKRGLEAVRLWDVMLFAGDMAKAELAGFDANIGLDEIVPMVEAIEQRYRESAAPEGPATADRGLVRIQGMLWTAKLALHIAPDALPEHLRTYLHTYEIA